MRAAATPTISFGLISIPIKAYLAASSENFSFNRITPDGNKVKQKLIDAVSEEEVQQADCVRGYEYEPNKFMTFTDEDIDALVGNKNDTIEIKAFANESFLSITQVEKAYYLAPDKGAEKLYKLLEVSMYNLEKIAICKWYTRGKDHLVALKSNGPSQFLTMYQLYYANEVRSFDYKFSETTTPTEREFNLAKQLIEKLSPKEFSINNYTDEFAERIRGAIEMRLANGKKKEEVNPNKAQLPILNMADLLTESLKEPVPATSPLKEMSKKIKAKK